MDALTLVRGAVAGLVATAGMTAIELAVRSLLGTRALLDWQQNQAMMAWILNRPVEASVGPGLGLHFLHGLVAGLVFVILRPFLPTWLPSWSLGVGYGLILLAITVAIHRPITGLSALSGRLGRLPLLVALATHVAFGSLLALFAAWP